MPHPEKKEHHMHTHNNYIQTMESTINKLLQQQNHSLSHDSSLGYEGLTDTLIKFA